MLHSATGGNRARLQHLALRECRCRASQIARAIVFVDKEDLNAVDDEVTVVTFISIIEM